MTLSTCLNHWEKGDKLNTQESTKKLYFLMPSIENTE